MQFYWVYFYNLTILLGTIYNILAYLTLMAMLFSFSCVISFTGVVASVPTTFDVRTAHPECTVQVQNSHGSGGCSTPKLNEPAAVALGVLEWRLCAYAKNKQIVPAPLSLQSVMECNELGIGCYCKLKMFFFCKQQRNRKQQQQHVHKIIK